MTITTAPIDTDEKLEKTRIYIKPELGEKPPAGFQAVTTPRGKTYYETFRGRGRPKKGDVTPAEEYQRSPELEEGEEPDLPPGELRPLGEEEREARELPPSWHVKLPGIERRDWKEGEIVFSKPLNLAAIIHPTTTGSWVVYTPDAKGGINPIKEFIREQDANNFVRDGFLLRALKRGAITEQEYQDLGKNIEHIPFVDRREREYTPEEEARIRRLKRRESLAKALHNYLEYLEKQSFSAPEQQPAEISNQKKTEEIDKVEKQTAHEAVLASGENSGAPNKQEFFEKEEDELATVVSNEKLPEYTYGTPGMPAGVMKEDEEESNEMCDVNEELDKLLAKLT